MTSFEFWFIGIGLGTLINIGICRSVRRRRIAQVYDEYHETIDHIIFESRWNRRRPR